MRLRLITTDGAVEPSTYLVLATSIWRSVVAIRRCRPMRDRRHRAQNSLRCRHLPDARTEEARPKVEDTQDLAGHRIRIWSDATNVAVLPVILTASGVEADKVAVTQFGTDQVEELARDPTLDAFMAVGPLDSKITSDAIAATARARGEPKFLAIEASDAIALKDPRYESEEIPPASSMRSRPGRTTRSRRSTSIT